jgi:hypothetical protein
MHHVLAPCRLRNIRPRRVARLACDRSRITRLPAMVARMLGLMISTTLARSSVAPVVLCSALVGR